jgi:hypothetical protein
LVRLLLRLAPIFLIAAACCALLFQHIDLTNTDLGRHLKNGETIVQGSRAAAAAVLHTNFYSYAAGDYPFVNHHWLAGVVFCLVWKLAGFDGLTLFYSLLVILAMAISYWTARRAAPPLVAAALAALIVPIVAQRDQVRPEAFTYLLTAVFYWVLLAWSEGWITDWSLASLPALMLLWINLHIGFVFGFLLLGAFALRLWAHAADRRRWAAWSLASAACVVAALGNPAGIYGLLYPLRIFGNYGYDIAENLSLAGIGDRHLWAWTYDLFLALLGLAAAVCLRRWLTQKTTKKTPRSPAKGVPAKPFWPQAVLLAILGLGGVVMIRNQPLFCLLMVPILAELLGGFKGVVGQGWARWVATGVCAVGLLCVATEAQERSSNFGLGLKPGVNNAAEFLRTNRITGPIFNDFDIGGYLIYNGYQVFVDGRPEAYPPGFFQNDYIPALSDSSVWERLDGQYHFNAIVISMQDGFPPVERFILTRVRDAEWAPVYTDSYSLIFVRRNDRNEAVIQAHLIPRSAFR